MKLFHVTSFDHGDTLTVRRKSPSCPSKHEPLTPRLCVCPSVPQCFGARLFDTRSGVFVYSTDRPMKGVSPVGVWDEVATEERWLLPGMKLSKVSSFNQATVSDICKDIRDWHISTRRSANLAIRLVAIWRASTAIPRYRLHWVDKCVEDLGIDPLSPRSWSEWKYEHVR